MIRTHIFGDFSTADVAKDLENFINSHHITRDQIISVSFSIDAAAHGRYMSGNPQQILLMWEDRE